MKTIYAILLCLVPLLPCSAQYLFHHFTVKNGLPVNNIHTLVQDSEGVMWFAAASGVISYDGQNWRQYSTGLLRTNDVFDIVPGAGQRMYLLDYTDGLDYLYHDSLYTIHTPVNRIQYVSTVHGIGYIHETDTCYNTLIFGNTTIRADAALLHRYGVSSQPGDIFCFPYRLRLENGLLLSCNLQNGHCSSFAVADPAFDRAVLKVLNGLCIIRGGSEAIALFNPETGQGRTYFYKEPKSIAYNVRQLIPMPDGIQVTTANGLLVYDRSLHCVDSFALNTTSANVLTMFRDKAGNIWIVTIGNGIRLLRSYFRQGRVYPAATYTAGTFYGGRLYFSEADGQLTVADTLLQNFRKIAVPDRTGYKKNLLIQYLSAGDNGVFGANADNIFSLQQNGALYDLAHAGKKTLEHTETIKHACQQRDTLYILLFDGVYFFDAAVGTVQKLYKGHYTRIAAGKNSLWLLTDNKHLVVMQRNGTVLSPEPNSRLRAALNHIPEPVAILCDTADNTILAFNHMVVVYNNTRQKLVGWRYYLNAIVAARTSGNTLLVATAGYVDLYRATGDGSYRARGRYYNFDHALYDDIAGMAVSASSLFVAADSKIVSLPLSAKLQPDTDFLKQVHLTSVTHGGVTGWSPELPSTYVYSGDRTVFHIACLSLSYGSHVTYRYFLEGIDNDWQQTNTAAVSYTSLPPGSYTLHVVASVDEYELCSREYRFSFVITPLWWQRRLVQGLGFISLVIILAIAGVKISINRKNKQLKAALLDKKATEVRLGTLQAQMNPHFVFNALTSVQGYLRKNRNEMATAYLLEFTQLMRQYLEFSRKKTIPLSEELTALRRYIGIESQRFSRPFAVDFISDIGKQESGSLYIPPMIIQPFVENAIHHGLYHKTTGAGRLVLQVSYERPQLTVVIDDNGIGRAKAAEINSHYRSMPSRGNEIVNERIDILARQQVMDIRIYITDMTDENGLPGGTRVTIVFIFNQEAL